MDTDLESSVAVEDGSSRGTGVAYPGRILKAIAEQVEAQGLSLKGRTYLAECLKRPDPASRGGKKGLTGKFASNKMGVSMHFSGWVGLAALVELDHDQDVVAFFDAPPQITARYLQRGRKIGHKLAPKIVVMRRDKTVLVDVQQERQLELRATLDDSLYVFEDGRWRSPPAEAAANELGFGFEVWTERHFNGRRADNLRILEDFFLESDLTAEQQLAQEAIVSAMREMGTPRLDDLIAAVQPRAGVVDALRSIARGNVFVDLCDCDLGRWETVRLFPDQHTLRAHANASVAQERASALLGRTASTLEEGDRVLWDGVVKEVVNVGRTSVSFKHGEQITSLSYSQIGKLLGKEVVLLASTKALKEARRDDAHDFLSRTHPKHLATANLILDRIAPYLAGLKKATPEQRTIRRYIKKYRDAERMYGNGYYGLIPGWGRCGDRTRRLSAETLKIVAKHFAAFATPNGPTRMAVFSLLVIACEQKGHPPPSYAWWCKFIEDQDQYKLKLARDGQKAAYQIQPAPTRSEFEWEWRPKRAWQTAYVDHTQLDIETVFSESGENTSRPWLSLMIDGYSRRICAFFISFHAPSSASVMMLVRDCVKRFNRLPNEISVDGGKEFRSSWFQAFCAAYKTNVLWRPPTKPRWGSVIERMFGTENTLLLYNLRGNTQSTKNVRMMSASVDPKELATWSLPALYPVHEEFYFDIYHNRQHTGILTTPALAEEASNVRFGDRPMRFVAYSPNFVIDTCPLTRKGTARVTREGVKVFGFWFNHREIYPFVGQDLPVRYDPYNLAVAWAWTGKQWLELSSRFEWLLRGMSEYEMKLISAQYREQMKNAAASQIGDLRFAEFLRRVLQTEEMLLERKKTLDLQRAQGWVWQEHPEPAAPDPSQQHSRSGADAEPSCDGTLTDGREECLAGLDIQIEDLDDFEIR